MNKQNVKRIDVGILSKKEAAKLLEEIKYLIKHKKPKPIIPKWR